MKKSDHSFFYLLCGLNFLIVGWLFSAGISGNDLWWHIKAGEWIAEHGRIPAEDAFSWVSATRSLAWTPHEWLSELIFYLLHQAFGEYGIFIFVIFISLLFNFGMLALRREEIEKNNLFWGVFFVYLFFLTKLFQCGRPQIFACCILFVELVLLYRFMEKPESRGIFWLPIISVLWSNTHGGSANLGYLLILPVLAGGGLHFSLGRLETWKMPAKSLVRLGAVFTLTVLGVFVNPVGREIFLYPYEQMQDGVMLKYISEWQPPDVKDPAQLLLLFVPVFLPLSTLMLSPKKIRLADFLFMLVFTYLFFRSVRFCFLYMVAAPFWCSRYVEGEGFCKKRQIGTRSAGIARMVCQCLTVVVYIGFASGVFVLFQKGGEGGVISHILPDEVLEVIKKEEPDRLFNDYDYGGELIFAEIPVFYDGRADLYSAAGIFAEGNTLLFLRQIEGRGFDLEELMQKYQFDGIVIRVDRPLNVYLSSHPERFERILEQGGAVYYRVR